MAAGAPSGEFRAMIEREKEIKKMEQNKEIKKYRLTCPKCDSGSFAKCYQLVSEEFDEYLRCRCNVCEYVWRMEPKEKEG